jgi:hypothetical protein
LLQRSLCGPCSSAPRPLTFNSKDCKIDRFGSTVPVNRLLWRTVSERCAGPQDCGHCLKRATGQERPIND